MPPGKRQSRGQGELFPPTDAQPLSIHFDRRAAFGRIPNPDFTGLDPGLLAEGLTDEDLNRIQPETLHGGLYQGSGQFMYNGLTFRPDEYEVLIGSHDDFTTRAMGRTLIARGEDDLDESFAAADRAQAHALTEKRKKIEAMLAGYDQEILDVARMLKEMDSPGYSHMSEIDLLIMRTNVRTLYFHNMLRAVAYNQRWHSTVLAKAEQALDYSTASENYRANFRYWRSMTTLDLRYTRSRLALAKINHAKTVRLIGSPT